MSLTLQIQIVILMTFNQEHKLKNCMHKRNLQIDAQIKEFVNGHNITLQVAKDYTHHLCQLNITKAMNAKDKGEKRHEKKRK